MTDDAHASHVRKTMLVTDCPPCSNITAGIVTAQMCRFVPAGELVIFCVLNPHLKPQPYPDLGHIPTLTVQKPNELQRRSLRGIKIGRAGAGAIELAKRFILPPRLTQKAADFAVEHGVTQIWAVMQGQTLVRLQARLARRLGVPLRTQVFDPLDWWLRAHEVDPMNRRLDMALFERTMSTSTSCATASEPMAERYRSKYGIVAAPVIASVDTALARLPPPRLHGSDTVVIGMIGQFYASEEWAQLVRALNYAKWQVSGRKVVIKTFGHDEPPTAVPSEHFEYGGWMAQEDLIGILADTCDILYCPYPFAPEMAEVAKLSFPSKVPTYLAAGRPILFHGPRYAAPAKYLLEREAGYVADDLYPSSVYNGLCHLVENADLFDRVARGAQAAFRADFTLEHMRRATLQFLGYV